MNEKGMRVPFESEPIIRSREQALAWVEQQLKPIVARDVILEGVCEGKQVEVGAELRSVDFKEYPECAPVAGVQLILGRLKDLLEQARAEGTMPHEERYVGLCISYLEGVEQETKTVADIIGLEKKVPGALELVETLEQARTAIIALNEQVAHDDTFLETKAA